MAHMPPVDANKCAYADKYYDQHFEYRHVTIPKELAKLVPRTHLMTETEWRNLGIQQSPGWVHYMIHGPEPHVLLFRRPRPPDAVVTVSQDEEDDDELDVDSSQTESDVAAEDLRKAELRETSSGVQVS